MLKSLVILSEAEQDVTDAYDWYQEQELGLVRRFPYAIFYEYLEDSVIVYGIFHCSQNPKKWRNRLP